MPQNAPTPDTHSLEYTKEPTPGPFTPVDEDKDIYPIARPGAVLPTLNTIAPENAPESNLGLLCFSIY